MILKNFLYSQNSNSSTSLERFKDTCPTLTKNRELLGRCTYVGKLHSQMYAKYWNLKNINIVFIQYLEG